MPLESSLQAAEAGRHGDSLDSKAEGCQTHDGDLLVSAVYEMSNGRIRVLETNQVISGREGER